MAMTPPYIINLDIWAISVLHDECWLLSHNQGRWCRSQVRLSTPYTWASHFDSPSPPLKVPWPWRGTGVSSSNLDLFCHS